MRFPVHGSTGPHGARAIDIDRRLGARTAAEEKTTGGSAAVGGRCGVCVQTRTTEPRPAAAAADGRRRRTVVRFGRTAAAAAARGHMAEARVAQERLRRLQVTAERQGQETGEQFQRGRRHDRWRRPGRRTVAVPQLPSRRSALHAGTSRPPPQPQEQEQPPPPSPSPPQRCRNERKIKIVVVHIRLQSQGRGAGQAVRPGTGVGGQRPGRRQTARRRQRVRPDFERQTEQTYHTQQGLLQVRVLGPQVRVPGRRRPVQQ